MKASEFASQILAHVERYGNGEVILSADRQAPTMHLEGADCLVIDQRVTAAYVVEEDDE